MESSDPASPEKLWAQPLSLDGLNALSGDTIVEHLGIEFTDVGPDYLRAVMPVDARTQQPFGLLHGGASVALAETLGSTAAHCCLEDDGKTAVGIEVNANHLRGVRDGHVTGTVRPIHVGRATQVWQIRIRDDEGRLVCAARLTMAVIDWRDG